MGLVEVFLLLLKLSTILKHLTNLLGLQETRPMKMIHLISTLARSVFANSMLFVPKKGRWACASCSC
jgi:hypothetical protein